MDEEKEFIQLFEDKTPEQWYKIISNWSEETMNNNLSGARHKENAGNGDNWSATVVRVASERGII